ncbi:MAG: hypothetical protein ACYS0I_04230 [Planctomycetota bacterium]
MLLLPFFCCIIINCNELAVQSLDYPRVGLRSIFESSSFSESRTVESITDRTSILCVIHDRNSNIFPPLLVRAEKTYPEAQLPTFAIAVAFIPALLKRLDKVCIFAVGQVRLAIPSANKTLFFCDFCP